MQLKYKSSIKAILLLEDGKIFEGKAAGKIGTAKGEIAFNTGMSGYQEVFTDPSYFGQILVMTNPHIGNYGVKDDEVESKSIKISGLVCKKFNQGFSRPSGTKNIQTYFEENNLVAISDVDTRALVRYIRNKGAMNCVISSETDNPTLLKEKLSRTPSMQGLDLSREVACQTPYFFGEKAAKFKVAVIDYGVKLNILRCLAERDCYLQVFPPDSTLKEILDFKPNGFLVGNGPGDPGVMNTDSALVKQLVDSGKPLFGICLGHQLLAQSQGISTYKMHAGHRGINHPVKNIISGKSEITSQNHGFTVNEEEIKNNSNIEITHINLNDGTIEGFRLKDKKVFSVQYHPEAGPGPLDARYLFDEFVASF
jgi:carbamoyl-phosphate synthase small subunit